MDEKWKFMIGLLNRPGTLHIAQRMMNENSRLGKRSGGSAHGACWWCLLKAIGSPIVCQDTTSTHWTCLLLSLASEVASSSGEDTAICPRFSLLPSLVQKNLLVLLSRHCHSIPLATTIVFLSTLWKLFHKDKWINFLLLKYARHLKDQEIEQSDTVNIALSNSLTSKISDLGRQFFILQQSTPGPTSVNNSLSIVDADWITSKATTTHDMQEEAMPANHTSIQDTQMDTLVGKKRNRADDESPGGVKVIKILKDDEKSISPSKVIDFCATTAVDAVLEMELGKVSGLKDSWLKGEPVEGNSFFNVMALESVQLYSMMDVPPSKLTEDVVVAAAKNVVGAPSDVSVANLTVISELWISPWLRARTECLSRVFTGVMVSFLNQHFTAAIDGVVIPVLKDDNIGTAQADFVCKLVRDDLTVEQSTAVFRKFIDIEQNMRQEPYIWNEVITMIAQVFISKKVNIDSGDVGGLVKVLRRSSHSLCTSIKFGMFMKNLISGYPHVLRSQAPALLELASSHKSSVKGLLTKCADKLVN